MNRNATIMTGTNLIIRPYKSSDKTDLLTLIDLNTPLYFASTEKSDFDRYLDSEIELYYVITFEGKIMGCGGINFQDDKSVGVISWDMVHPNCQGKSFGKQLLHHRIETLKKIASIQKIIVRTSQLTYKFYQKQGFQATEIVSDYWAPGFDLYFMEYYIT